MYWVVLKRLYERRVMADPDQEGFSTVPRFSHSPSNSFLTMRDPGTHTMRGSVHTPGGESRSTSVFLQRSELDWALCKRKKKSSLHPVEMAEEWDIKLSTFIGSRRKQRHSRKISTSASLTTLNPLMVWIKTNCGKVLRRWEYQTPHLSPEKRACRSRSNN